MRPTSSSSSRPAASTGRSSAFELASTELQQHPADGQASDFDQQNGAVRLDRDHGHGARVPNDVFPNPPSVELEFILFDTDDRALVTNDSLGVETGRGVRAPGPEFRLLAAFASCAPPGMICP